MEMLLQLGDIVEDERKRPGKGQDLLGECLIW